VSTPKVWLQRDHAVLGRLFDLDADGFHQRRVGVVSYLM